MESPAGLIPVFACQDCTAYDKTVDGTYNTYKGGYIYSKERRQTVQYSYAHELFNYLNYFQLERFSFLIKFLISVRLQSDVLSNVVSRVCEELLCMCRYLYYAIDIHIHTMQVCVRLLCILV